MPIRPLVKEFIQGIVRFNTDMIESIVQGVLMLFTKDMVVEMLLLPQVEHFKLLAKYKESNLLKIAPPEVLVDREGWKVSMLKGIYVAKIFVLVQAIQLKGSCFIYVAKKLMILVALVETKMQINSIGIVFNNLHSRLKELGGPHKFDVTRDAKFGGAQILDIVLRKWFLVDPGFWTLDSKQDE